MVEFEKGHGVDIRIFGSWTMSACGLLTWSRVSAWVEPIPTTNMSYSNMLKRCHAICMYQTLHYTVACARRVLEKGTLVL